MTDSKSPTSEITEQLGFLQDVKVDVDSLWDIVKGKRISEESIPALLDSVMLALKVKEMPKSVKRKVATTIMQVAIKKQIKNPEAAAALSNIVPFLIDMFCQIANSKTLYKIKKSFAEKCKCCC